MTPRLNPVLGVFAALVALAMCPGQAASQICDEFDGATINSSVWETVSGDWTQGGGRLTGYWNLSSAHGEQGVILFQPGQVPAADYTLDADMVVAASRGSGNGNRLVLQNSVGNKYMISLGLIVDPPVLGNVAVQVKQNGGMYSVGIRNVDVTSIANFTPGAINRMTLVRHGTAEFSCCLNGHHLFSFPDSIWGGNVRPGLGAYGYAHYERACIAPGGEATPTQGMSIGQLKVKYATPQGTAGRVRGDK